MVTGKNMEVLGTVRLSSLVLGGGGRGASECNMPSCVDVAAGPLLTS